jgi:hypothetical protein
MQQIATMSNRRLRTEFVRTHPATRARQIAVRLQAAQE